jgi:hypothetical protein
VNSRILLGGGLLTLPSPSFALTACSTSLPFALHDTSMKMKASAPKTNDLALDREKNEVITLLHQFMMEMKQWELACLETLEDVHLELDKLAMKERGFKSNLENIYQRFCTSKKRKRSRLGSYGIPTDYDPDAEKVIDVVVENHNRITVFSERDIGLKIRYKYVFLRRNQKWLLDNRQSWDAKGRWRRDVL